MIELIKTHSRYIRGQEQEGDRGEIPQGALRQIPRPVQKRRRCRDPKIYRRERPLGIRDPEARHAPVYGGGRPEMSHTSNEVKERYYNKTYHSVAVTLRKDDDHDIIVFIEAHKKDVGTTQLFREALKMYMKEVGK